MARITADAVGRRVSVRRRTPAGAATDVVGDLVSCSETTLVVRDRENVEHQLDRGDVITDRVVVPVPAARRAVTLERIAAAGWPAPHVEQLGAWQLRAAGGFTSRANSALAIGDPGMPFAAAADAVRDWYAQRGLSAAAAVIMPSVEDDAFAALGWEPSPTVLVEAAGVRTVLDSGVASARVTVDVTAAPSRAWLARYTARGEVDDVARQVLVGTPVYETERGSLGFAQVGDPPDAIGRGVVVAGWVGISAVEVVPDARRQGLASAVTHALAAWGAQHGAEHAYLQVHSGNAAARALYAGLGFGGHHRYRYRIAPG